MSGLTTHVLDLVSGKPAAGVRITLSRLADGRVHHLADAVTNADGRLDAPLIAPEAFTSGVYELAFHVGDYFGDGPEAGSRLRFLDVVPLRFGVADPKLHYHVPLLVTPWSFSTYRGS